MKTVASLFIAILLLVVGKTATAATWTNIHPALTNASGTYDYYGHNGLTVDRATGNLFMSLRAKGIWKSADQGKTFVRADGNKVTNGVSFFCWTLISNPEGGKLAVFNMNNTPGPSGYSLDSGNTWKSFTQVRRNWDFGVVDWNGTACLATMHEDTGLEYSSDMGKIWRALPVSNREVGGLGIFNTSTLVIGRYPGIFRSIDSGNTWKEVTRAFVPIGPMVFYKEVAYWICNKGGGSVLTSRDSGKTWQQSGTPVVGETFCVGPVFGKNDQHLTVATTKGIMESLDGGSTWTQVTGYPAGSPAITGVTSPTQFPSFGYDPDRDIYYVHFSNYGFTTGYTYKYDRGSTAMELHTAPAALSLNVFPLPFNSTLNITHSLAQSGDMALSVFTVSGKKIATVHQEYCSIGTHTWTWNGKDNLGNAMPAGTYVITLKAPNVSMNRRVVFLK